MPTIPTLLEMLAAGVHFGHQESRWHPKMEPYIFGKRNGVHIINLEMTRDMLGQALEYVKETASQGKLVLFLGTKRHITGVVEEAAKRANMPYITERWIGGLVTNFPEIKKLIQKYSKLKKEQAANAWEKYTKRERLKLAKEVEKMDTILAGIINLDHIPEVIFITDMRVEKTAVKEANQEKVPIVGICDTNINPLKATYVIPANDDAVRSVALITNLVADAVLEGRKEWEKKKSAAGAPVKKEVKVHKAAVVAEG